MIASDISSPVETMRLKSNVKMLCSRVQTIIRQRRRKQKRSMEISAPFNLKLEPVCLPGLSEDELSILREKAAASRIGVAESMPRSVSSMIPRPARPAIVTVFRPGTATTS